MITQLTGLLTRVRDEDVRLRVGPIEYQILVPEAVRRQIQMNVGQEVTFHLTEYLEGNQGGNRFVPRKVGFLTEDELDFFELFCTVEKIGVKKALKALARPVKEIANAISREDAKWLTTLPGIGATTAEQIVTTLKRKVTNYALGAAETGSKPGVVANPLLDDVYQSLLKLGMTPLDSRTMLDKLIASKKEYTTVQDAINLIFAKG